MAERARERRAPVREEATLAWFDHVREIEPVCCHDGVFFITRYEDVRQLLTDPRLGSPYAAASSCARARSTEGRGECFPGAARAELRRLWAFFSRWPVFSDASHHDVARRAAAGLLSQSTIGRVRGALSGERAGWRSTREAKADVVSGLVRPMCLRAVQEILGLEDADLPRALSWSADITRLLGSTGMEDDAEDIARLAGRALADLEAYVARERRAPVLGDTLDVVDTAAVFTQLLTGTLEPTMTTAVVAAEGLVASAANRALWRDRPDRYVSEAVRIASPFHLSPRTALIDITLRGVGIMKGQPVMLGLAAANRDPRAFPRPLAFSGSRSLPHVAFGRGPHVCIGAAVARLIVTAVLHELAEGLPATAHHAIDARWRTTVGMRTVDVS